MKSKSKPLKIVRGIAIAVLLIILVLNLYILIQAKSKPNKVPSIFGYKPFVVLSGSMETEIFMGDLVVVKNVDKSKLSVNDIIAFRNADNYVTTHRIVDTKVVENETCFVTKGDHNNTEDDSLVCPENIEGKYLFRIANLGNFILFIQKPVGFILMMLTILIICMFIYYISNRNINSKLSDEELKEFEEFKKMKRKSSKEKN